MHGSLMQQGGELMLFGMGTVFIFLSLLVVLTGVMSSLLQRYVKPEPVVTSPVAPAAKQDDAQLIAVISAAIHQHRSKK